MNNNYDNAKKDIMTSLDYKIEKSILLRLKKDNVINQDEYDKSIKLLEELYLKKGINIYNV